MFVRFIPARMLVVNARRSVLPALRLDAFCNFALGAFRLALPLKSGKVSEHLGPGLQDLLLRPFRFWLLWLCHLLVFLLVGDLAEGLHVAHCHIASRRCSLPASHPASLPGLAHQLPILGLRLSRRLHVVGSPLAERDDADLRDVHDKNHQQSLREL